MLVLAIALSSKWLQWTGHSEVSYLDQTSPLPEQFVRGLTTACLQGRAQIVPDRCINPETDGDLLFYLDGAHSPESMEACARWFSLAIRDDSRQDTSSPPQKNHQSPPGPVETHRSEGSSSNFTQILLFNRTSVRDPQLLLPRLMKTCASQGVYFKKALFVPNTSVYYKVGTQFLPPTDPKVDLLWQFTLQRLWESLARGDKGGEVSNMDVVCEDVKDDTGAIVKHCENSAVFHFCLWLLNG